MKASRFIFYSVFALLLAAVPALLRPGEAEAFAGSWLLWRDPVLAGMVCGTLASLIGVYMLLNRIVFVSLAVAQAAGLGIFLSFFAAAFWDLHIEDSPVTVVSGFACASLTAFFFTRLRRLRFLPDEVVIGMIYAFSSAFIVLLGDRIPEGHHHLDALLFGNAVAVTSKDLRAVASVTALVMVVHAAFRREFVYTSADADFMRLRRMNASLWQGLLYLTLTLSITVSLKTLGSLPAFGLMIVPPYLALKNAVGLRDAFAVAIFLGLVIPPLGYYYSFLYAFPTGASVILVALLFIAWGGLERAATSGRIVARRDTHAA